MRTGPRQKKKQSESAKERLVLAQHQKEGADFLAQRESGLFLDPGLRKTSTMLTALMRRKRPRALVLSLLRVVYEVWPREVTKWGFPLETCILHGSKKADMLYNKDADLYLLNCEGLPWFVENAPRDFFVKRGISTLIVDESTAYKNPTAKTRLKLLKPLLPKFQYRHILTGTPTPRGLLDLWAQIYILDQGKALGEYYTHYKMKYFYPVDYMGYDWRPKPGAEEEIYDAISHLVFRRDRSVLTDMPPLVDNYIYVDLPPAARKAYRELEVHLETQVRGGEVTAANSAVVSGKCRQLAGGAVYDLKGNVLVSHDAKTEALLELIDSLQGSPLLVLYEFQHEADRLMKVLPGAPRIGGGVSPKQVTHIIDRWNRGELPVLLAHAGSIAHGLNLQDSGHNLCWYSLTWNLEHYQQAYQRLWRSGQKHRVINHHIVARDTVDEVIIEVLKNKSITQTALLKALENRFKEAA